MRRGCSLFFFSCVPRPCLVPFSFRLNIERKTDCQQSRQNQSIRHSQTARLRTRKMSQSEAMFLCVSRAVQKVMLLGCDWWFSIRFYFIAEKSLTMTRTCTVVNFHNFHGQLGSLVFDQTESSDQCWFVVKWLFQRDPKGKLKIPCRRKDQLVVSNQVVTYPCCGLSVIFCGFISHLIARETINIPEIFSGVHGFMGKTVIIL